MEQVIVAPLYPEADALSGSLLLEAAGVLAEALLLAELAPENP